MELLRQKLEELDNELASLDQAAEHALNGEGNGVVDLVQWRDRRTSILVQRPILESQLLQAEIFSLKEQRHNAKCELTALQAKINKAADDWRVAADGQVEKKEDWDRLQMQGQFLDQKIHESFHEIAAKRRQLIRISKQVVGIENGLRGKMGHRN